MESNVLRKVFRVTIDGNPTVGVDAHLPGVAQVRGQLWTRSPSRRSLAELQVLAVTQHHRSITYAYWKNRGWPKTMPLVGALL